MHQYRDPNRADAQSCARALAIRLSNRAWDLIERDERTFAETDEMIDAAHAARELWAIATGARSNVERLRAHHAVSCAHYRAGHREAALHAARQADVEERALSRGITQFDHVMTMVAMHLAALLNFGAPSNEVLMDMVDRLGREERELLSRILPWPKERFAVENGHRVLSL